VVVVVVMGAAVVVVVDVEVVAGSNARHAARVSGQLWATPAHPSPTRHGSTPPQRQFATTPCSHADSCVPQVGQVAGGEVVLVVVVIVVVVVVVGGAVVAVVEGVVVVVVVIGAPGSNSNAPMSGLEPRTLERMTGS